MISTPAAWLLGGLLFVLPFARYGPGSFHRHPAGPHMDHRPRHGGLLGMAGDHHIELLRRDGRITVFPSDAMRRHLDVASVVATGPSGEEIELEWTRDRWQADDQIKSSEVTIRWRVAGEASRSMQFTVPGSP